MAAPTTTYPDKAPAERRQATPSASPGRYTGVILIHGIGDVKRNGMLQQAINALSYWYNHQAGFALRSEGPGRVWLTTELTEDDDPDAPASRATIELSAPPADSSHATLQTETDEARLEVREVWWAASFGLPDIAATIRWARVQWREQMTYLLMPIGRQIGPAHTAARQPAREVAQALTYRPPPTTGEPGEGPASVSGTPQAPATPHARRTMLRATLKVYDALQYLWKAFQWLVLTPLIALLLVVMGIVQLLAVIPFLRTAIIAGFNAIINTIMLHWISEIQVYLLDYTRSSAIRQRFERELDLFLRDERCDRVVVVAESAGTMIAYEGLTTALAQPDVAAKPKPVTYICVSSALRRVWLLAETDSHRMRGVLPEYVRWLHFWARYDPVAAGPLSARSLPPIDEWDDSVEPNPYDAICASLERCENVDVANSDSTFSDHTTYWDNLEQVVGPIARELVAGHPALEQVVQARLATPDDVLTRRGRIAWRAAVSVLGGLILGAGILLLAYLGNVPVGDWVQARLGDLAQYLVNTYCQPCQPILSTLQRIGATSPEQIIGELNQFGWVFPFLLLYITARPVFTAATALAVAGLGTVGIGRIVAMPSPATFKKGSPDYRGRWTTALALAFAALLLAGVAYFISSEFAFRTYPRTAIVSTYVWSLGLAQILGIAAYVVGLVHAARKHWWGWFIALLLTPVAVDAYSGLISNAALNISPTSAISLYVPIAFVVALVGCLFGLVGAVRGRHRLEGVAALLTLAALAYTSFWSVLVFLYILTSGGPFTGFSPLLEQQGIGAQSLYQALLSPYVFIDPLLPVLIFGLWSGPLLPRMRRKHGVALSAWLGLTLLSLLLFAAYTVYVFTTTGIVIPRVPGNAGVLGALVWAAYGAGALALVPALFDAARGHRWGWLAALIVGMLAVAGAWWVQLPPANPTILLVGCFTLALCYGLWSGTARGASGSTPAREGTPAPARVPALAHSGARTPR